MRAIGVVTLNGFSTPGIAWLSPRTVLVYDTLTWQPSIRFPCGFVGEGRFQGDHSFLVRGEGSLAQRACLPALPTDDSVGETTLVSID